MDPEIAKASVEQWMRANAGVIAYRRSPSGYAVTVGATEVFIPAETVLGGIAEMRQQLKAEVEQAMLRKAEALETAAAALRAAVADGVQIPPGPEGPEL